MSKKESYIEYTSNVFNSICNQVYNKAKEDIEDLEKNIDGFGNFDIQVHNNEERNLRLSEKYYLDGIFMFSRLKDFKMGCKFVPFTEEFEFWFEKLNGKLGEVNNDVIIDCEWLKQLVGKKCSRRELANILK